MRYTRTRVLRTLLLPLIPATTFFSMCDFYNKLFDPFEIMVKENEDECIKGGVTIYFKSMIFMVLFFVISDMIDVIVDTYPKKLKQHTRRRSTGTRRRRRRIG